MSEQGRRYTDTGVKAADERKAKTAGEAAAAADQDDYVNTKDESVNSSVLARRDKAKQQADALRGKTEVARPTPAASPTATSTVDPMAKYKQYLKEGGTADFGAWKKSRE